MKLVVSNFLKILIPLYIIIGVCHISFPKWDKFDAEATISHDVSGYYLYLPALFIYKDIKQLAFMPDILTKYKPSFQLNQAFKHEQSSNMVMKYSIGQSILYAPFFFTAHIYTKLSSKYPSDGFSGPYQFFISLSALFWSFLGLFFLMKVLLKYFERRHVFWGLVIIVLGTNYLNYSAIDGAMTHNYLFSLYAILLFLSEKYHTNPSLKTSILIGGTIGLAALIRPTEIISFLIPVLWKIDINQNHWFKNRIRFLYRQHRNILAAILTCLLVGSIQLFYWKFVTNEWIVYSYENQGFSWLNPHFLQGLFSYKSGWLMYTPLMIFPLIGFFVSFRKAFFLATIIFFLLFTYITYSWDIWWYGGSLGQRAMVQSYAILSFPLVSLVRLVDRKNIILKSLFFVFILLGLYFNIWLTYQGHGGGYFKTEEHTKAYYLATMGRLNLNEQYFKLLDTEELFFGQPTGLKKLFESDTTTVILNEENQFHDFIIKNPAISLPWIRLEANFLTNDKEWTAWKMTQMRLKFYQDNEIVKERFIRIQRFLEEEIPANIFLDVKKPDCSFDKLVIHFYNSQSSKEIQAQNVRLYEFSEP